MPTKPTPPADPVVTISNPKHAEPPAPKPPVIGELPAAFDPKALAVLADSRDKLKAAEAVLERAAQGKRVADEAFEGARASLDVARKRALDAATALLGTGLADNFLTITDDEARKLQLEANNAKRSKDDHVRAKLFG